MQSSIPITSQVCKVSQPLQATGQWVNHCLQGDSFTESVSCACSLEHLGASQTCCCLSHAQPSGRQAAPQRRLPRWLSGEPARQPSGWLPGTTGATWVRSVLGLERPYRCEPEPSQKQRSHSLSGSARQITPPISSGHAPPSTGSRKSSQSVHPCHVLA